MLFIRWIMGLIAKMRGEARTGQSGVLARPRTVERSEYSHPEQWARAVIVEAHYKQFGRGPTLLEAQFAQAVARGESGYGRGWKDAGVGSHNWGAVQAGRPPCGDNAFPYGDNTYDAAGKVVPYSACFRRYPDDVSGAADMMRIMYRVGKGDARAAANAGDIAGVSAAMRANRYFELPLDQHIKALTRNLTVITTALDEPMPSGSSSGGGAVIAVLGIGALAYGAWKVLG